MSSLFFHPGSSPDLFLIACAVVSLTALLFTLRARRRRGTQRGSARG